MIKKDPDKFFYSTVPYKFSTYLKIHEYPIFNFCDYLNHRHKGYVLELNDSRYVVCIE